ncbi:hypothetical protein J3E68DRAFT_388260 [Trichoderma sp. SZMC 28012]
MTGFSLRFPSRACICYGARTYCNASMPVNTYHPQLPWSNGAAKSRHLTSPKTPTTNLLHQKEPPLDLSALRTHPSFSFLSSHLSSTHARHIHVLKRSAPVSATRLAYGTLRRSNIVTPRLCSPSRLIILLLIQVHVCDNACQRNCHAHRV